MKLCFFPVLLIFCVTLHAQQHPATRFPSIAIKWSPTGLLLGNISLLSEFKLNDKHAITLKTGIPVPVEHTVTYNERNALFLMKAFSLAVGYRTYLKGEKFAGTYLEPYFKFNKHTSTGLGEGILIDKIVIYEFANRYEGTGFGVQIGHQFRLKERWIIDAFIGPEINSAINTFSALERTSTVAWSDYEAKDIEKDTREFINKFPFLKNRFEVNVNKENRFVSADFLGILPGLRAGVSIGIAF